MKTPFASSGAFARHRAADVRAVRAVVAADAHRPELERGELAHPHLRERVLAGVAHGDEVGARALVEVADEVRAPVAEPDDRDADRLVARVLDGRDGAGDGERRHDAAARGSRGAGATSALTNA